ncbi:hypothetical protein IKE67_10015 [bacterium]|nr:hypothetical protein [bacterium]
MSVAGATSYNSVIPSEICQKYGVEGGCTQVKQQSIPETSTNDIVEISGKEKKKKKNFAQTAVLLVGGAVIGYCLRKPIGKVIGTITDKCSKFFSQGKPAEFMHKAKSFIFSKK